MCEGGVATWNRSSGPSPSAATQCSVPRPIERWVWRTALGRPGGAGAEHEDGLVVGESTGAGVVTGSVEGPSGIGRALGIEVDDRVRAQRSMKMRGRGAIGHRRDVARSAPPAAPTSADFHAGLTSTDAAPTG